MNYSAFSDTGSSTGVAGGPAIIKGAYVGTYAGGLGVTSAAGVNSVGGVQETTNLNDYGLDNGGNKEMMLLSFTGSGGVAAPVTLSSVNITGLGPDTDLSILAYGGSGTPFVAGKQYGDLLGAGWTLVGNYGDVANGATSVNGGALSSSYWLIGAYNSIFGTVSANGGTLNGGNDFVKLLSVSTTSNSGASGAPEPSSLLLAAVALFALSGMRRRRAV